jgi:hypothetical protein
MMNLTLKVSKHCQEIYKCHMQDPLKNWNIVIKYEKTDKPLDLGISSLVIQILHLPLHNIQLQTFIKLKLQSKHQFLPYTITDDDLNNNRNNSDGKVIIFET